VQRKKPSGLCAVDRTAAGLISFADGSQPLWSREVLGDHAKVIAAVSPEGLPAIFWFDFTELLATPALQSGQVSGGLSPTKNGMMRA
jgi:hypothetical protein